MDTLPILQIPLEKDKYVQSSCILIRVQTLTLPLIIVGSFSGADVRRRDRPEKDVRYEQADEDTGGQVGCSLSLARACWGRAHRGEVLSVAFFRGQGASRLRDLARCPFPSVCVFGHARVRRLKELHRCLPPLQWPLFYGRQSIFLRGKAPRGRLRRQQLCEAVVLRHSCAWSSMLTSVC